MAYCDSADLLARCKRLAARPATDTSTSDTDWYAMLSEAQSDWYNTFAAQVPFVLMGPPTTLVSTDGGLTYPFPGCVAPLAVEIYDSTTTARLLKPSAFFDPQGDIVWEGDHIRFPLGKTQTYANGPVARWINPPDVLDASHAPTLIPTHCRLLLVYGAVAEWADRGGFRDPTPFLKREQRFWYGDERTGKVGALAALKLQHPFLGASAYVDNTGGMLEGVSTGSGYAALRLGQG